MQNNQRTKFLNRKMALINERKNNLIKHYPQLEQIYARMQNRPDGLQYLIFIKALARLDDINQSHFNEIINVATLHGRHISVPALKCRFMRDTGKQANPKRPCMGNWVKCENSECPMDEYFSGYCKPGKCNFFEPQVAN